MKRLEAKYGKISGENSEDEEDPDASWTSNYLNELLTHKLNFSSFDSVLQSLIVIAISLIETFHHSQKFPNKAELKVTWMSS